MSNKAVTREHRDIANLQKAQKAHAADAKDLRKDERAQASDKKSLKREKDNFDKNGKALAKAKDKLNTLLDTQKAETGVLDQLETALQQAYQASVDPTTGQGDANLQAEIGQVEQMKQQMAAQFQTQAAPDQASVQKLQQQVSQNRLGIKKDRADIKKQTGAIKHEKKAVSNSAAHVKSDRKKALNDLQPAEYQLGLKDTNKLRKQLGLKAVKSVVRPGVSNVVGGQVGKWIAEAQTILKNAGVPMSKMNAHDIAIIIQHESSGNPNAVNNWDSNAAAGHPSEGLMQTIGPTFDAYKLPGHGSILNPVDNIIAGVRYAISRYGSISNVPGVVDVHAGRAYVGY